MERGAKTCPRCQEGQDAGEAFQIARGGLVLLINCHDMFSVTEANVGLQSCQSYQLQSLS